MKFETNGRHADFRVPLAIEKAVIAGALALICVISFANVLVRYFTDFSFAFTEEISVFMLIILAFFGSAVAFAQDEQIRITFFLERMNTKFRWGATVITLLANLAIFMLMVWFGGKFAYDDWRFNATTPGLGIPAWLYSMWLPIAALVIIARLIGRFQRQIRQKVPD
ncbi:MAG: TRAP transporter small permease [Spiribacter sp.]|jgi:TRAP-type C4-dicarboxylate transport system permease small subunit|nr:TRAP transporter small permease [Spiribacter sp.]MDR9489772.1 TRAP transporter small permease [Spiribacter sp.]